ncbi:MAG: peroxiredoxin family protein [Thermodesulfobacteriota bacterium]
MNNGHVKNPEIGTRAPQFRLPSIQGTRFSLYRREGTWVVLVFYRGSWCPMCNIQMKSLARDYPRFQALNAEVIAVSADTPEGAEKIRDKSGAPFPILLDEGNSVTKSYGLLAEKREWKDLPALVHGKKSETYAIPGVFIIDPQGILRYSYVSKSFKDRVKNDDLITRLKHLQRRRSQKKRVEVEERGHKM